MIKRILLFSCLIVFIPLIIVSIFIRNDEVNFIFTENSSVRVYRTDSKKIDKVPLEEYVVGVLAGEMPINFELEALKAQAVAARSYVMKQMEKNNNKEYDVVDTVMNQVYLDNERLVNVWKESYIENINKLKMAVLSTKGEYISYDNKVAEALFLSKSPGITENSEEVFVSSEPYLRSVISTWDNVSPIFTSNFTYTLEEFYKLLGLEYKENLNIEIVNKTSTGRIKKLRINNIEYDANVVCAKLSLNSTYFEIIQDGNKVIVKNKGYGHGVGMSQYGAQGMAKEGFNYQEILKYYYKDIEIKKI